MGSGLSVFKRSDSNFGRSRTLGLDDVPENCVSSILLKLDPADICKFATLNRKFRDASLADFVWETKLPSNYEFLVRRVLDRSPEILKKKDIYATLCRSNFFDAGTKRMWLDKSSGKICLAISYKEMRITGIHDRRHWTTFLNHQSRFNTIAYLKQTWWLEVVGELEFEFPPGNYSLFFRLQLGKSSKRFYRKEVYDFEEVYGWSRKPVGFQLSTSDGQHASSECYLQELGNWSHHFVGEFFIGKPSDSPMKIRFSMMQIDCTHTKGGLSFDSVFICPSEFSERLIQI